MTDRYAVFGHPVAHSKSPQIHATFGRQEGIAVDYRAIDLAPEAFLAGLEAFAADGGVGANVTSPHKEAAFSVCTTLTARAPRRFGQHAAAQGRPLAWRHHRRHRPGA